MLFVLIGACNPMVCPNGGFRLHPVQMALRSPKVFWNVVYGNFDIIDSSLTHY